MLLQQNIIAIILIIIDLSKQTPLNSKCSIYSNKKNCDIKGVVNVCATPEIQNGKYEVLGSEKYIAGQPIPNFSILNLTCDANYTLTTPYNTVHCLQGNYSHELPKCVLTCSPDFPISINVDCELNGTEQDCTKNVLEGTIANMKCKPNFIDNNPEISKIICSNGTWNGPPKLCRSADYCSPRVSNAINIFCELNGNMQDCSKDVPDDTVSHMSCKQNYVDVNYSPSVAICKNGTWNIPLKQCIPDCKEIVPEGKILIINGNTTTRNDFPWHVAIYRQKSEKPLKYICGGSIISIKIVISAAHCFTDTSSHGNLYPVSEFSLAAGKLYSKWDAPEDAHFVQKRKIIKVEIPKDIYFGILSNHAGDLAVVVVDQVFILTSYVKPVCVDWNLEYVDEQLKNGSLGKVAGWGSITTENPTASVDLKQLLIPFVERGECTKIVPKNFIPFVTTDKYCAGYTKGSSICDGDSGGGMVFPHEDAGIKTYYLQGIVSVGPKREGYCDDHQIGVYTKVEEYIEFIRKVEESNRLEIRSDSINKSNEICVAPKIQNGNFTVTNIDNTFGSIKESSVLTIQCNSGYNLTEKIFPKCVAGVWDAEIPKCVLVNDSSVLHEGKQCPAPVIENGKYELLGSQHILGHPIPNFAVVNFTCKNDNFILNTTYTLVNCINGNFSNYLPKCILTCPARFSSSVDTDCELNEVKQDCFKKVPEGTVATMKCKLHGNTYPGSATATCHNGTWDSPLDQCVDTAECGVPTKQIVTVDGVSTIRGEFPWHVAIYDLESKQSPHYKCGGSIITVKIVLSVANCVTDNKTGKLSLISEFLVAAGKYFSAWDAYEDDDFVQIRNISKIEISNRYLGSATKYAGDIAVIVVVKPFIFSNFVKPVCVDWNSDYVDLHLKNRSLGQVAGWGAISRFQDAKVFLRQITIPIIDIEHCIKIAPKPLLPFITPDKYCGGYANGTGTCNGDSGSGMIFSQEDSKKRKKYYIQGLVSVGLHKNGFCDFHQITVYTKVADYISLIKKIEESNRMN